MGSLLDSLKEYFEKTPKDILDHNWNELKQLNELGPDVVSYAKRVKEYYGFNIQVFSSVSVTPTKKDDVFDSSGGYYLAA